MIRIRGRKKVLACAYCGRERPYSDWFPAPAYARCWTCWLKENPRYIEPVREALRELVP